MLCTKELSSRVAAAWVLRRAQTSAGTDNDTNSWAGLSNPPVLHLCWKPWGSVSTCCLSGCCFPNTSAMEQTSNPPWRIQCPAVIAAQESKDSDVPHHHCLSPALHLPWAPRCPRAGLFLSRAFQRDGAWQHVHIWPSRSWIHWPGMIQINCDAPSCVFKLRPSQPSLQWERNASSAAPASLSPERRETKGREWLVIRTHTRARLQQSPANQSKRHSAGPVYKDTTQTGGVL